MAESNHTTKKCTCCKQEKPLDDYHSDKTKLDGKYPTCKECVSSRKRASYHANLEENHKKQKQYYDKNKDRILSVNAKSREKNRENVLQGKHHYYEKIKQNPEWQEKQKQYRNDSAKSKSEYDKQYRSTHKERRRETSISWVRANKEKRAVISLNYRAKRRSIEKSGDSFSVVQNWIKSQVKKCYWCGIDCEDNYHVDHYIPLIKGGEHKTTNLVIACPSCNLTKNAKDPYKFAASVGRLF